MVFSSFLSSLLGSVGSFSAFGLLFLVSAVLQNKMLHFVQFEDNTHEFMQIQVLNIYQQPFLLHEYKVRRFSESSR